MVSGSWSIAHRDFTRDCIRTMMPLFVRNESETVQLFRDKDTAGMWMRCKVLSGRTKVYEVTVTNHCL